MKKFKKFLLGSAGLVLVAGALSLAHPNVRRAVAEEFKDVRIINTQEQPALTRDVDHPAREPFQTKIIVGFPPDAQQGTGQITFPSGKRFVMEHASAEATLASQSEQKMYMHVGSRLNNIVTTHALLPTHQGTFQILTSCCGFQPHDVFSASQPLRLYGDEVSVFVSRNVSGPGSVSFSVSGYLVDVP